MIARIRRHPTELVIAFSREGQPLSSVRAADGARAAEHAFHLIGRYSPLRDGDFLFVKASIDISDFDIEEGDHG